jgi:hypothetical protein
MNRDDAISIALAAAAHHHVDAARELRRQCVTAVLQRLIGDDMTDVECADLADELTVA